MGSCARRRGCGATLLGSTTNGGFMIPIPPALAEFAARNALRIVLIIVAICAYFAWSYHVEQIGYAKAEAKYAKRDAETARKSAALLAVEKADVERSNNQLTERLKNAVTIYAEHTNSLNADVDNLVKRMRNSRSSASCSQDPVPRSGNDNRTGKSDGNERDYDIAIAAIRLANLCEYHINRLEVVDE